MNWLPQEAKLEELAQKESEEGQMCVVCMERPKTSAFVECGIILSFHTHTHTHTHTFSFSFSKHTDEHTPSLPY
jgi:hypothetical protein